MGSSAFQRLVEMCGLSSMFASHAMARAIGRAGVTPERMTAHDLPLVLGEVERALRPFLCERELSNVLARLRSTDVVASW